MKLIAENVESAYPVMPVSWCLEPKDKEQVEADEGELVVLFIMKNENGYEIREIAPATSVVANVEFDKPGLYRIQALLWRLSTAEEDAYKGTKNRFVFEQRGIFDEEGNIRPHALGGEALPGTLCEIEVEVPADHFPKKPHWLLWKIANVGHETEPKDQCHFRRRLIFCPAFLILLGLYVFLCSLFKLISAAFLFSIGRRNVGWWAVFDTDASMDDVSRQTNENNNWIFTTSDGSVRAPQFVFFAPIVWVFVALMAILAAHDRNQSFWRYFVMIAGVWSLISLVIVSIFVLCIMAVEKASAKKREERLHRDKRLHEERASTEELYDLLGCSTKPINSVYDRVPPKKRTLRFKLGVLKAKVCRPYATQ